MITCLVCVPLFIGTTVVFLCKGKREVGVIIVKVPSKPLLPGTKSVPRIDDAMQNVDLGKKATIRLAFGAFSSRNLKIRMPDVKRGSVTFFFDHVNVLIKSNGTVEFTERGNTEVRMAIAKWNLSFNVDEDKKTISVYTIGSLHGKDAMRFLVPAGIDGWLGNITVDVIYSVDFEGDRGSAYVMTPE